MGASCSRALTTSRARWSRSRSSEAAGFALVDRAVWEDYDEGFSKTGGFRFDPLGATLSEVTAVTLGVRVRLLVGGGARRVQRCSLLRPTAPPGGPGVAPREAWGDPPPGGVVIGWGGLWLRDFLGAGRHVPPSRVVEVMFAFEYRKKKIVFLLRPMRCDAFRCVRCCAPPRRTAGPASHQGMPGVTRR